ncbi:hypothetical protein ACFXAE_10845 [Streptomyces sp. NPDC059454]|uniref:hypothetical protein n=1 Tax=Streptomyces sp. NPDC059454 TaxID=3346836 RepID=UPI0036779ADB
MPSSPQHPASTPSDLSGAVAEDLALYREKFRRRLPESLDELRGPTHGVVDLPLHMAWSGMTSYDLGKPRQHMSLYRTVLHEDLPLSLMATGRPSSGACPAQTCPIPPLSMSSPSL